MHLTDDVRRQLLARPAAQVWLEVLQHRTTQTYDDAARAAGLRPIGPAWREVDAAAAADVVASLLRRSLAHGTELMLEEPARALAERLVDAVAAGGGEVRCGTNLPDGTGGAAAAARATSYPLDAGVVLIGAAGAVVYWVAEDAPVGRAREV